MTDLDELIAKLETASEGCVALDIEIAQALGWTCFTLRVGSEWVDASGVKKGGCSDWPFTTSLDAALTLVPEDPKAEITGRWDWQLECTNGGMTISARVGAGSEDDRCFAATPELALCIAALRARQAVSPREGERE